jgi:Co/Zn/Cd efflux system component
MNSGPAGPGHAVTEIIPVDAAELDQLHRQAAYRAIAFSALGLALTGGIELVTALITHSVALLGDSLHNLADV